MVIPLRRIIIILTNGKHSPVDCSITFNKNIKNNESISRLQADMIAYIFNGSKPRYLENILNKVKINKTMPNILNMKFLQG